MSELRDPGPDELGETNDRSERETIPGPAPEPTPREIMNAIESVAMTLNRMDRNVRIMRMTLQSQGRRITELESRVGLIEDRLDGDLADD